MKRPRAILSDADAFAIYSAPHTITARGLGEAFGVSEKAVRDIRKGRTWARVTRYQAWEDPFAGDFDAFLALVEALVAANE